MKTLLALVSLVAVAGCATTPDRVESVRGVCAVEYGDDRDAFATCVRLALRRSEEQHREQRRERRAATGYAMQEVGRSMTEYGQSLSARPVRCTSVGIGTFTRTTCR